MKLELVPIPVSDVDRAKAFYEKIGFGNLHEYVNFSDPDGNVWLLQQW
jgi:predicted lactoylglutathione lyase